jgi:hypothetical protein
VISGLSSTGCGGGEAPPSPASEQYKEAKRRGDEARAKEYGRKSIDEKKATVNQPAPQKSR